MEKRYAPAFLDSTLLSLGGWYPLVVQFAAQLLSFGAAALGVWYILLNVEFTSRQIQLLINVVMTLVAGANVILLVYMYSTSAAARKALHAWSKKKTQIENAEIQALAWRQITRYPWRFGVAALLTAGVEVVLPSAAYMYYFGDASLEQAIHVAFGGLLSASMLIITCVIIIEYALTNARLVLTPSDTRIQMEYLSGIRLQTRLYVLVVSSVGVTILLTAPRAYQVAVNILNGQEISLATLRTELIWVTAVAVVVSGVLAALFARLIYMPINHIVSVMSEIEKGETGKRADILGTDEIGTAIIQFNTMIEQLENLRQRMDEEVANRTSELERKTTQLQAAAIVAREAAAIQDVKELLNRSVNLISERFGFYHAGIFIADQAEQYVVLQAASSTGGQKMLERGHQLRIGGQSIVGTVAASRRPRIALDVGEDAVFFSNPDLPETHSEVALPLMVRGHLIGVLDIQATERRAFLQDDMIVLQTMADQIALAIQNARLYAESQQAIKQLEASVLEGTRTGWEAYTRRKRYAYVYTPLGIQAASAAEDEPGTPSSNRLEVPIILRGQRIGRISMKRAGAEGTWDENEQNMAVEIANQIGLAIENARLLEEQQRMAARERQISTIVNEIRKSASTERVLQQTAREIGKAMGAVRTFVQLGLPTKANGDWKEHPQDNALLGEGKTEG